MNQTAMSGPAGMETPLAGASSSAEDRRTLFNQVLVWGLSMSVVGAVGCYAVFGRW